MFPANALRTTIAVLLLIGLVGCQDGDGFRLGNKDEPPPEPPPEPISEMRNPVMAGTVGAQTLLANAQGQVVRGFGLVVGLGDQGSGDCPSVVRDYLIDYLAKQLSPQQPGERFRRPSPSQLVDSLDTAVVEVRGTIPTGAKPGYRFDVQVEVVAGTSTRSIEGGMLWPTELRYFDRAASGQGMIAGATLARASGPVFVNPFSDPAQVGSPKQRSGLVLGGGQVREERVPRLMLVQPSYQLAQTIERRINERFGHRPAAADAMSRGYLDLHTPAGFEREPERFLTLIAHLLIDNRPGIVERRLRELNQMALADDAQLDTIALVWEGIGRNVVGHIQALYAHQREAVRFYAARAGLRLGDITALPALVDVAERGSHAYRLRAIRALGNHNSPQIPGKVAPLLSDEDQEVRIAAYEAMLNHSHRSIRSHVFRHVLDQTQHNFVLDIVDCDGPPLIYVRRTRLPRIAVFGERMPVTTPVYYRHPDESLTVVTVDDASDLRVFAKAGGRLSDQLVMPPRVVDLVTALAELPMPDEAGQLRGLGLPYSRVVQVLSSLCKDRTIGAKLVLESTPMTDLLGPQAPPERPEGEYDNNEDYEHDPWEVDDEPARPSAGRPEAEEPE